MILLSFDIEKLTTEHIQELGLKWLERLPKGWPKTLGERYLFRPASNQSRNYYGTCQKGREGVIGIFLEIIANVLIHEHEEAKRIYRIDQRRGRLVQEVKSIPEIVEIPWGRIQDYKIS